MSSSIPVPEFLNKCFFEKALRNGLNEAVKVSAVHVGMGCDGGDNYCSDIFRAKVTYSGEGDACDREVSLIIKAMKPGIEKDLPVPTKEIAMFLDVIPACEKVLAAENAVFAPKCYYIETEPECVFVFEDLVASGYELQDRVVGLDLEHALVVLRKIGQLHAASIHLAEKNPDYFNQFDEALFESRIEGSALMEELCKNNGYYLAELASSWEGYESIGPKIRKIVDNFRENVKKVLADKPGRVRVLNHGDLWVNNFFFKYDAQRKPVDLTLIDLQLSYWGSPGVDLHYFLSTSIQLPVLQTKRYELLWEYYKSLRSTAQSLNCSDIPSWDSIREEVRSTELYAYATSQVCFPLIALDKSVAQDSNIELYKDKDAATAKRRALFSSPRLQECLKYYLYRLDELKVFD